MNNKGWGLSTLIGFLAIFGVFLLISSILYNKNFSDINDIDEEETEEKTKTEVEEAVQEEEESSKENITYDDYQKLETVLKDSAEKYIKNKKISSEYKTIITYNDIKNEIVIIEEPDTSLYFDLNKNNVVCKIKLKYNEEIDYFDNKIIGFNGKDAIIAAPETRTSSPIRILRDENLEASIKGIYPCGEGAGYAGGITTSAMDGMKIFESIYKTYKN